MSKMTGIGVIGLTGQSGAGKTTVCKVFEENGFAIINADLIARQVVVKGSPCLKELAECFGESILTSEKELDRKKLAKIVFTDDEKRKQWTLLLQENGFLIPTLVHPSAYISEDVELGTGTVVCARASISNGVKIGKGCIIEVGVTISRNTVVPSWTDLMN